MNIRQIYDDIPDIRTLSFDTSFLPGRFADLGIRDSKQVRNNTIPSWFPQI